jgi:hypothetical protein
MKCEILAVRMQGNLKIAHVQAGEKFGDCLAGDGAKAGPGVLKPELRIRAGRFEAIVKVQNRKQGDE